MHRKLLRIAAGYEATGIDRSKALAKNFDAIARQSPSNFLSSQGRPK
ncbi:hypothetical protein J2W34_001191 [Variovorax boronicumulans]|nr:hypothetical protein [Variovorax boronicumulans]MDQ0069417.1 hypothetical protein [Variovorax boronicumulans]